MHVFKDRHGDDWTIDINIGTRERLKAFARIDLYDAESLKDLLDALDDPSRLTEILMVVCEKEVTARGLAKETFQERFDGDAIQFATDAFLEEFKLFIRPGMRPGVTKMLAKIKELQTKAAERMEKMAERTDINEAVERVIAKEEAKLTSEINKFGNEPPSSE